MKTLTFLTCLLFVLSGNRPSPATKNGEDILPQSAAALIDSAAMKAHIQKLASDEMEGRAPGGKGEELATAYIADFYKTLGLKTQFQAVPMVGITSSVSPMKLAGKGGARTLKYGDDFVGWSKQQRDTISSSADLVFCGYGVTAPEYQWNDFKDDVKGKIIVVLINDPQLEDQSKFGGKAMTYYGRWTYKYEEAARQGAAGVLIVHETDPAAYGWATVKNSNTNTMFDIVREHPQSEHTKVEGWIQRDLAVDLFRRSGLDFEALKKQAQTRE